MIIKVERIDVKVAESGWPITYLLLVSTIQLKDKYKELVLITLCSQDKSSFYVVHNPNEILHVTQWEDTMFFKGLNRTQVLRIRTMFFEAVLKQV